MLFNSEDYIFKFLPLIFFIYLFFVSFKQYKISRVALVMASLFFYSYWHVPSLGILLASMLINFFLGEKISQIPGSKIRRILLISGIVFNVGLLGFFKYYNFFAENLNLLFGPILPAVKVFLPLALSFYTFQQIAYLVDSYKNVAHEYSFLNYCLFVTFFPHIIAGPITHHKQMMPQFERLNGVQNEHFRNICRGLFVFAIGLSKKVLIADTFGEIASFGYDKAITLDFFEAWLVSLCYTLQIYFDFSGYTDMAIGSSLLFNIRLPDNFNSPYKAKNIQDFWRRWHITLSVWLRDYIYIPLGGSKTSEGRTYINLFLTFLIGGFWHGASWMFVIWGILHGLAVAGHRYWSNRHLKMPPWIAWGMTFLFVHITWIFFRAPDWERAKIVLKGIAGLNGIVLPQSLVSSNSEAIQILWAKISVGINFMHLNSNPIYLKPMVLGALLIAFLAKNSSEMLEDFQPKFYTALAAGLLVAISLMNLHKISEFLYFQF